MLSLGGIPLALEHDMWGALEPVGLSKGLNARTLIVPDSGDLGHLFEPFEGQVFEPLISRTVAGWQLGAPVFSHLRVSRVPSWAGPRTTDQ
jgi:hypothetical protein